MAQKLIQTQEQKLQLQQRLTAQQLLQVKLLEMPLTGLEESVRAELDDNPALETLPSEDETADSYEGVDTGDDAEDYESQSEREERAEEKPQDTAYDPKGLLVFCQEPRTRKEVVEYLEISSAQYALHKYLDPLVKCGAIRLTIPEKPKSPKQKYVAAARKDRG